MKTPNLPDPDIESISIDDNIQIDIEILNYFIKRLQAVSCIPYSLIDGNQQSVVDENYRRNKIIQNINKLNNK